MDQGDDRRFSGLVLATPGPAWTEGSDPGVRLTLADGVEAPTREGEAHLGSEELPDGSEDVDSADEEPAEPLASDLVWHLNWLRNDGDLSGFEEDERLGAIAESYCPELGRYFDEHYDPTAGNWAEAMVHDASGTDLATRTRAAGYPGWTAELLAWTASQVDLSLVARGFWDAPTHAATLLSADLTLIGASICEGGDGYFYVVVIGGGAAPLEPDVGQAAPAPGAPSHNPFIIP